MANDSGGNLQVDFVWGHTGNAGAPTGYPLPIASAGVTVPDLRNSTQAEATATLVGLGLTADVSFGTFVDPVWGQQPLPGAKVIAGTPVHLTGTPSKTDTAKVTVPNVVGLTLANAKTALTTAGFTFTPTGAWAQGADPVGKTSPVANHGVAPASAVAMTGSATVPNEVGATLAAATSALTTAGFAVLPASWPTGQANPVKTQTPAANTVTYYGATVTLVGT